MAAAAIVADDMALHQADRSSGVLPTVSPPLLRLLPSVSVNLAVTVETAYYYGYHISIEERLAIPRLDHAGVCLY